MTRARDFADVISGQFDLPADSLDNAGGGGGLFKGENGEVGSSAGDIFRVHEQALDTDTTIDSDENALCAGPLTISTGVTLTINGNLSIV